MESHFAKILTTPLLPLLLICSGSLYSQNPHVFYYENEFNFGIPASSAWSFEIGFANRGMLQERMQGEQVSGYEHNHIELSQFSSYKSSDDLTLSLGIRYRFREIFDADETNEFRIIQQLEYEHPDSSVDLEHRLRVEQRFRKETIYRVRYELETSHTLSNNYSLGAATEALYAVSPSGKPEAEQRFSLGLQNSSFERLKLELKVEYRMENYARDLENEYFIITELNYEL